MGENVYCVLSSFFVFLWILKHVNKERMISIVLK